MCCYPTETYSQPSCAAINILIDKTWCCCAAKEREQDQYRDIAGHQQVETGQQQQQQKVNMSADNYLMQEELGSTF